MNTNRNQTITIQAKTVDKALKRLHRNWRFQLLISSMKSFHRPMLEFYLFLAVEGSNLRSGQRNEWEQSRGGKAHANLLKNQNL